MVSPLVDSKDRAARRPGRVGTLAASLILLLASTVVAQVAPDSVLRGFAPISDYRFVLDGKILPKAEIYRSSRAGVVLILSADLTTPVLLSPSNRSAEGLDLMKVIKRPDGTVDVMGDASLVPLGALVIDGQDVTFRVGGKPAKLEVNPFLLSWQTGAAMRDYSASYVIKSRAYRPDAEAIAALRGVPPTRLLVFFGSWCPACSEYVPRILRVQEELSSGAVAGRGIQFEYYGLPRWPGAAQDPQAKKFRIDGVPTAILLRGDQELGRLEGLEGWQAPEKALRSQLAN